mmetsp:Transcript_130067/g.193639  ORF Transcript_130067/g.193639 Transcript_130067/m.193639 type:complete len:90 (+) Transcript_130067:50-319(+)
MNKNNFFILLVTIFMVMNVNADNLTKQCQLQLSKFTENLNEVKYNDAKYIPEYKQEAEKCCKADLDYINEKNNLNKGYWKCKDINKSDL